MNQESRIQKIDAIVKQGNPYGKQDIPWKDKLESFNVYQIPLECLIYNKYNGRILSSTLSLEKQGHSIDPESNEGKFLIEDLLWKSKEDRNKRTLESIKEIGQEKVGIVTRDGIIIDGNRRAMLLNKAGKAYFKAIILPVSLEDDRNAIEELETKHQMGEDKKLDYNPIEKYLKAWNLEKRGVTKNDIADWMGESISEIEKLIGIKGLIDEYLEYLGYDGIYTSIRPGQEDLFISLHSWTNIFYGENSSKGFDGYTDGDVDDLKFLGFDYIRVVYGTEDKKFRKIANGLKENHFFGRRDIWKSFSETHFKGIIEYKDAELPLDLSQKNLESHIQDRDNKFTESAYLFLNNNFNRHLGRLNDIINQDKPYDLVTQALGKLNTIKERKDLDQNTINILNELNDAGKKILGKKSPLFILKDIISELQDIDFSNLGDNKEEVLEKIKLIHHETYEIKRQLGA